MNPPLRIGYVIQTGVPDLSVVSGPMLHVLAVAGGLRRAGHPVRMVVTRDAGVACTDDQQTWRTVPYGFSRSAPFRLVERPLRRAQFELGLPYANVFESLRFSDACARALQGHDLLYERHGYLGFGGALAARRLGVPLVIELNGNIVREIDERRLPMSAAQRRLGRWITARTLAAADHVVVVSDALRREVVEGLGLPAGRVSTVLNGLDTDLFARASGQGVRARYGLGAGPVITFVGHFQPWHGLDLLADAFARVHAEEPASRLLLVGDGDGRDALAARVGAASSGVAVVFAGRLPQEEVARVLQASDVLVAPYPYRHGDIVGTPLKLLEYMASGRGIVASTAPIHELLEDGVTGVRVAPADAGALAQGILRLVRDVPLREALGRAARRRADGYSWDGVVRTLLGIFRRLRPEAAQRAPPPTA